MLGVVPFSYIFTALWTWIINTGLSLGLLVVCAFLIPRAGRLAMFIITNKMVDEDENEAKSQLALAGVVVYVAQILGYFLVFVAMLQQLGFSLAGAAIPATAASAAIGLGAQSIIADFLAGFFILTEKQYGVGDWVRFEGGATNIEGTVIQITIRATKIRTLREETVIIPNSKAGVSINNSNHWSSAVVVMPIPLLSSTSIDEAIARSTEAAKRALLNPEVAQVIWGPLTVHPAVAVNAPSTVGMPWTVDVRFLVQVKPGEQWVVERAIRVNLIDEFWKEYGSATTVDGQLVQDATPALPTGQHHYQPIQHDHHPATITMTTVPAQAHLDEVAAAAEEEEIRIKNRPPEPAKGWVARMFSFGGRMRASTTVWILVAITIVVLKGLTLTTNDSSNNGWLAPTPAANTTINTPVETTTETPQPTPTETLTTETLTSEPHSTTEVPSPSEVVGTPVPGEAEPAVSEPVPTETQQFPFNLPFN